MLLQEKIEESNSAIINILDNKVEITGFLSEERLFDYYNKGIDCRFSFGIYSKEAFDIAYIKDNALFVILDGNKEVSRYKFIPIKKDILNYNDTNNNNKTVSKIFTIRKCYFTKKYNYIDTEKSLLFDNESDLLYYFKNEYDHNLIL